MNEIKVQVVKYPDRKALVLRYKCPLTGLFKTKSAKTTRQADAVKAAGKWEAELREGRYRPAARITWADFRERYETEVLASLAARTDEKVGYVFDSVEEILNPERLASMTSERISQYQAKLREGGKAESTIKSSLAHLKAALRWAERVGLMLKAPSVEMPKRAKVNTMKGRPIAGEELDRMLAKCAEVVGAEAAASWSYYLNGLWLSGLRLSESLELWWDRDDKLCVDLDGKHPMLRIPGELEKGNKDRLLPIAPEFAEFLLKTPKEQRTGRVFLPLPRRKHGERVGHYRVSELVSAIGKAAGVKVANTSGGKVKYASAHDLRRSFGERWSSRVMPQVLKELMRHESIDTTLRYYVGRNADTTAAVLWAAHESAQKSNTSGNSGSKTTNGRAVESTQGVDA